MNIKCHQKFCFSGRAECSSNGIMAYASNSPLLMIAYVHSLGSFISFASLCRLVNLNYANGCHAFTLQERSAKYSPQWDALIQQLTLTLWSLSLSYQKHLTLGKRTLIQLVFESRGNDPESCLPLCLSGCCMLKREVKQLSQERK